MPTILYSRSRGIHSQAGFSLIEIVVVLVICAVLAMLVVVFQLRAVETSRLVVCSKNLREVYVLMAQYLKDNNNVYPYSAADIRDENGNLVARRFWAQELEIYTGTNRAGGSGLSFVCPATKEPNPGLFGKQGAYGYVFAYVSYGLNRYGISPGITDSGQPAVASSIENPSEMLLAVDWDARNQPWEGWYYVSRTEMQNGWDYITQRHSGKINALYCDGHVKTHEQKESLVGATRSDAPWQELRYTIR